jgi:alpha/beta superfamily hydrolase
VGVAFLSIYKGKRLDYTGFGAFRRIRPNLRGGGESDTGMDGGEMTCEDQEEVTNWVVTTDTTENLLE